MLSGPVNHPHCWFACKISVVGALMHFSIDLGKKTMDYNLHNACTKGS